MKEDIKLNYDDITVMPEVLTDITSRSECNPYDEDGYLPIFASCMSSVVSMENAGDFNAARIKVVIPRSYSVEDRLDFLKTNEGNFVAFSLNEAKKLFVDNFENTFAKLSYNNKKDKQYRICIDLANGHMKSLLETIKQIKNLNGDRYIIMTGNIANPKTYEEYEKAGVDFVRLGIGGGSVCFIAGTKVKMADGTECNIEDIDKGDYVMTTNGPKKVLNTFIKETDETICINEDVECTPNHKFFVVKKNEISDNPTDKEIKEKGFWVEAKDLNKNYLLVQA